MKISNQYIAGLFDGEGHAFLRDRRHRAKRPSIDVEVVITNTCYEVLDIIQRQFKGKLHQFPNGKNKIWKLKWNKQQEVINFLTDISPFLIIKSKKIKLILSYLNMRKLSGFNLKESDIKNLEIYKHF